MFVLYYVHMMASRSLRSITAWVLQGRVPSGGDPVRVADAISVVKMCDGLENLEEYPLMGVKGKLKKLYHNPCNWCYNIPCCACSFHYRGVTSIGSAYVPFDSKRRSRTCMRLLVVNLTDPVALHES